MNIVMLSGGNGIRLWPLSTQEHPKQLLTILKRPDGYYESMLQRTCRYITSVDSDACLTIATSEKFAEKVRSQIPDNVALCVEPCRRDTFPAIALASAFLHYEKGIPLDEVIVIAPIDAYAEESYYQSLFRLQQLAELRHTNVMLMGIQPTYPSEKYGYIMTQCDAEISNVISFKEKPDTATARKYIEQDALWNAGVFAVRVGYVLEKMREQIDFLDYRDLYEKYAQIKAISFDYAVLEREKDIHVMRYFGEWRDIGSWETLIQVMDSSVKGHVFVDNRSTNTHVINELNIPVVCAGADNLIIAISESGILIANKSVCEDLKPLIEKSNQLAHSNQAIGEAQPSECSP